MGADDWALRCGVHYGSIVGDLETHRVADVFEGRDAATVAAWFATHPPIEVVSRDRTVAYPPERSAPARVHGLRGPPGPSLGGYAERRPQR